MAIVANKLANVEPTKEPMVSPKSKPIFPVLGPKLTKFRLQIAIIPPIATTGNNLRGRLKIVENPIADMAAAMAYSI